MTGTIILENGYREKCFVKRFSWDSVDVFLLKSLIFLNFKFCKKSKKFFTVFNGKIVYLELRKT